MNLFVFVCFPLFPFLFMEYLNILMIMMGFGLLIVLCLISKKIEELADLTIRIGMVHRTLGRPVPTLH